MKLFRKFLALFRKETLDAEMAEEMRMHLERRTQANLAAGMSDEEALYAARRQFGGVEQLKEVARDGRGVRWLEEGLRDLRFAFRQLARTRGFSVIALLTIALGIGVNTSMFSMLNALLFHVPPYPEAENLLRLFRTTPAVDSGPHSPGNFIDLHDQARAFSHLAAFAGNNYSLAEPGQRAEQVRGIDVSGDFFAALGVQPALGRFITAEDDQPGHGQVLVLSDPLWRGRFGADPGIVGRQLHLAGGDVVTVIGVMPPGFNDPLLWGQVAAWRPLAFSAETRSSRGGNWLGVLGRLKPGVTSAQALAEINAVNASLAQAFPETNARSGLRFVSLARSAQDKTTRMLSWFAMGLAVCILLIACANLANLLFARNAVRAHEQAIRAALGASRFHLIRLALTESLLLAVVGGAGGLVLAAWCNQAFGARLTLGGQTGLSLPLDWRVLAFAATATIGAGVGFGILPAIFASRTNVASGLKTGGRGRLSGGQHRLRHALIVAEVALALLLLSGAGFFLRGLDRFTDRDHGWRPDHLITAGVTLPWANYRDDASQVAFYEKLQSRLSGLPGVEHVAVSRTLPFTGFGWGQRFVVEGRPLPAPGAEPQRDVNGVSPEYFETLGLTLVAGRNFSAADIAGPERTIISESMARQLFPHENPIGKRIRHPSTPEWQEVIGVVRNVTFATNFEQATTPFQTYRLMAREPGRGVAISLRSALPASTLNDAVRRVVAEIDPELPLQDLQSATQVIERGLANYALTGRLLSGFALLGLLLAAVGLYGVISGFVTQRTNEIGLRMALGAQVADVLRLVLGQGLRLALIGAGIGLAGAVAMARWLAAIMPALPTAEGGTAVVVTVGLLTIAAVACLIPARRAAKIDPMVALRSE